MRKAVFLIFLYLLPIFGVTLIWDRNIEPEVVGYKIYQGTSSRDYRVVSNAGDRTSFSIDEIIGVTNYFAATAYDLFGLESDFSEEVVYFNLSNSVPVDPPNTNVANQVQLNIRKGVYGVEIYFEAKSNVYYTVEITTNFINWEGYLTTFRPMDAQIVIPWPTWSDKTFFRVSYNLN